MQDADQAWDTIKNEDRHQNRLWLIDQVRFTHQTETRFGSAGRLILTRTPLNGQNLVRESVAYSSSLLFDPMDQTKQMNLIFFSEKGDPLANPVQEKSTSGLPPILKETALSKVFCIQQ